MDWFGILLGFAHSRSRFQSRHGHSPFGIRGNLTRGRPLELASMYGSLLFAHSPGSSIPIQAKNRLGVRMRRFIHGDHDTGPVGRRHRLRRGGYHFLESRRGHPRDAPSAFNGPAECALAQLHQTCTRHRNRHYSRQQSKSRVLIMSTPPPRKAAVGAKIGTLVRKLDKRFGVVALLNGEPRPPRGGFDLEGEKLIDWGWICANLPAGPKRALEIGPGRSPIIPAMLEMGYEVTAVDSSYDPRSVIDGFRFVRGDFNDFACDQEFEVIVVCSVVEHLGLAGRYNSKADP